MGTEESVVVVVEDDPDARALTSRWLEGAGFEVEPVESGEALFDVLPTTLPDCVCLDLDLPGISGFESLQRLRATHPRLPVVILTGDREVNSVVEAMQAGAYDYLAKPLDKTRLLTTIRRAVEKHGMDLRIASLERGPGEGFAGMLGESKAMRSLFRQIERVAASDVTVLLRGESGAGKELVASAVHGQGPRASKPFVAINCAAIAESLQEAELFGHEKGAFTGAAQRRQGRFEQADGGTLFLDEVAELSASLQAKLLRVLQERSFHRLGGTELVRVDIRVVAASHRDLGAEVSEGRFREDLFFRLAVFEMDVPPLRERGEDVLLLARAFATVKRPVVLDQAVETLFLSYHWPGNVRELQNAIDRALVVCRDDVIRVEDLPRRICETQGLAVETPMPTQSNGSAEGPVSLEEMERRALVEALERCGGNLTEVVRQLGIGRTTVYRKLKKYGLR